MGVARAIQRRLRTVAPDVAARLTWALQRRGGDLSHELVDAVVRPGDAVVDAGANWGLYAARLARLVGPGGRVDAFEPHPVHARTLGALARRHPQLHVHAVGLGDEAATRHLRVPLEDGRPVTALAGFEAPLEDRPHEAVEVEVRPLDAVLPDAAPRLIKIDVEGSELALLQGAAGLLARARPVLLVEIEQRHQERPIADTFAFLDGLGYEGWFLHAGRRRPLAEFDVQRHQLDHLETAGDAEMPEAYVGNFVFAAPGTDLGAASRS